jgi:lipopolysaccharide transport system permease protein
MRSEIKQFIQFRDLFFVFIWREFSIRYRQSILGILWAIVQPFSMMLLFTFVFTYVMPVKVSDYPYPIFFYSALLPWGFFASSLNYAVPSLVNHYNLVTKIYFPREILPLSGIVVALIDFGIASLIFVLMMFLYGMPFSLNVLWFFPLFFLLALFTISVSLCLAALNVYYRDVNLAISLLVQLWFFATPIFYSVDKISPRLKIIIFLNPLAFIIENMRRCLIEGRAVVWWQYLIVLAFVLSLTVFCYAFFRRTERRFADVI